MDQSMRTVATQLLNATGNHEDLVRVPEEKIVRIETPMQVVHLSTRFEDSESDVNKNEDDSGKMKFGIPVNSKFGHFELSNPGHAMAMTEEEIEKELASATVVAQKNQPTTASMLSTWIQLYPPATTTEGNNVSEVKIDIQSNQILSSPSTKLPSNIIKQSTIHNKPIKKIETKPTTAPVEKTTEPSISTTKAVKNSNSTTTSNFLKVSTTLSTASIENDVEGSEPMDKKPHNQHTTASTPMTTKSSSPAKKTSVKISTTPKPKTTPTKIIKPSKANISSRIKPITTRRPPTNKNDTVTSTSKIEKVTLKPLSNSIQNRTETTEKPYFITKIKASVLTDSQKQTTSTSTTTVKPSPAIVSKTNFSNSESSGIKLPTPTRINNILKVHTKRPIDDTTKIEIQPIRVNPPVLTIERFEDTSSIQSTDIAEPDLENSKIDVKFDFNPNVEVQTSSESILSSSTTTTRRPRPSNKRKKNKTRRRKPSTTTTTTLATPSDISDDDEGTTLMDLLDLNDPTLSDLQESKIEPESKAPPSKKKKPGQTQVQKPIGTQIYNFLSREVMPSVGVMSLVGLGLGLASYFLYPFGGAIARRNYDVEPNYKYNLDEYGGNYGLSEEEVLSKVYSGMTGGQHHETKYNPVDKNPNYYRYTGPEQTPQQLIRYSTPVSKPQGNRVIYRPVETTSYDVNYRNTEFRYPDVPTTPNYYERQRLQQQKPADFSSSIGKSAIGNNRQFVVGNIPKEYSSGDADKVVDAVTALPDTLVDALPMEEKGDRIMQYQQPANENYAADNMPVSPLTSPALESLGNPAALVSNPLETEEPQRSADAYEEMEIAPTAVAVEHGPRSLKFDETDAVPQVRRKRNILPDISSFVPLVIPRFQAPRIERSSVIQVIPSKSEIEKERKEEEEEEDLSNEILDIIDEALPGKEHHKKKHEMKKTEPVVTKINLKDHSAKDAIKGTSTTTTTTTAKSASPRYCIF